MEVALQDTEIELGSWLITEGRVREYLDAVADGNQEYFQHRLAPTLALAAYTLGALLEKLNLPAGAIHSLQEVEALQPVPWGEEIRAIARVERPRRRGNLEFITVTYSLENSQGQQVQTGKTTVLVTGAD